MTEHAKLGMCDALEAIQQTLNELVWSPETLETVAEIMRDAGYRIADPSEEIAKRDACAGPIEGEDYEPA